MTWLPPSDRLTVEQTAAVDAPADHPLIVRGGPGSGKTVVLLHRARRLLSTSGQPAKIRLLVFTNVLRDFIRSAAAVLSGRYSAWG